MEYKSLHEVLADAGHQPVIVEKKGSKLIYGVRESESSYLLDDGYGGSYFIGKGAGSIAFDPLWRRHTKVLAG